jgi:hypothetical protein
MSIGDIAVYVVAFLALALVLLVVLNKVVALARNWREVVEALGWVAVILAGGAAVLACIGVVVVVGVLAYGRVTDQRMMQQCTTLYERQAKATTAPDDYFGRQFRQTIADEAKQCAEFAAHKEAAKVSEK